MPAFSLTQSYLVNGATAQNVFHFRTRAQGPGSAQELFDRWDTFLATTWKGLHSSITLVGLTRVQEIGVVDGPVILKQGATTRGSVAGGVAPSNLAIVIGWRSQSPNRRKNGRTYLAGFSSTWYDGNLVSTVGSTALANILATFLTTFGTSGTDPYEAVVYSETGHKAAPGDIGPHLTAIQQVRVSTILRGQRRRQQDVGI